MAKNKAFSIIVPPAMEAEITGFILAGEKRFRNTLWRIEAWRGEARFRIYKDGDAMDHLSFAPLPVCKMAETMRAMLACR